MNRENRLLESLQGLGKTRKLVFCALMIAMHTTLNAIVSIPIGSTVRITFGYIVVAANAMLLGPIPAAIGAMLTDILGCILYPIGPYFPGFTITAGLGGLIYGLMFYKRDITLSRVLIAKLLIDIFLNILLNTLWLKIHYGKGFFVTLPSRFLKNVLQYPVDVLLLYPFLRWFAREKHRIRL